MNQKCQLQLRGHFPYGLVYETIIELGKRQIPKVRRVWPIPDQKGEMNERVTFEKDTGKKVNEIYEGFLFANYQKILYEILNGLPQYYSELCEKMFPAKTEIMPLKGCYTVAVPMNLHNSYIVHYQPSDTFNVLIVEYEDLSRRYASFCDSPLVGIGRFTSKKRTPISKDGVIVYYQLRNLLFQTLQANGLCNEELSHNYDDPIGLI